MPTAKHSHPNERNLRRIKKPHAAPPILSESQNQNQRIPLSVPRLPSVSEQNNGGKIVNTTVNSFTSVCGLPSLLNDAPPMMPDLESRCNRRVHCSSLVRSMV